MKRGNYNNFEYMHCELLNNDKPLENECITEFLLFSTSLSMILPDKTNELRISQLKKRFSSSHDSFDK